MALAPNNALILAERTSLYSKHLLSAYLVSSTVSGTEKAAENTTGSGCPQEVLLYPGGHATKKGTLTEHHALQ